MSDNFADKALTFGTGGLALLHAGGNPVKALSNPFFTASMFASPSRALERRKSSKQRLLSTGRMDPAIVGGTMMKRSGMQKAAGFWSGLKRVFLTPTQVAVRDQAGNIAGVQTKKVLRKPWAAAATVGGVTAGLMGLDYLQGQMRTVERSKSYRNMMKEYGEEISAIARESDVPVPEEEIQNAFNALYTVAPDIAKDPTLAAAQMGPIIREVGTVHGYVDEKRTKPRVMLEHGLTQFGDPSSLQGRVPRQKQISDYATGAASMAKGLGAAADFLTGAPAVNPADEYLIAHARARGQAEAAGLKKQRELESMEGMIDRQAALEAAIAQARARGAESGSMAPEHKAYREAHGRAFGELEANLSDPRFAQQANIEAQRRVMYQQDPYSKAYHEAMGRAAAQAEVDRAMGRAGGEPWQQALW